MRPRKRRRSKRSSVQSRARKSRRPSGSRRQSRPPGLFRCGTAVREVGDRFERVGCDELSVGGGEV